MPDGCEQFNKMGWHDSKLLEVAVRPSPDRLSHDVELTIQLLEDPRPGHYRWKPARITFRQCALLRIDFDLDGKRECSHDIADAVCLRPPDASRFQVPQNSADLADFCHFRISLIHPGGELDVVAVGFEMDS